MGVLDNKVLSESNALQTIEDNTARLFIACTAPEQRDNWRCAWFTVYFAELFLRGCFNDVRNFKLN
eukprot:scaffold4560_cov169-Ochromonas_danica.AAC.1